MEELRNRRYADIPHFPRKFEVLYDVIQNIYDILRNACILDSPMLWQIASYIISDAVFQKDVVSVEKVLRN